VGYTLDMNEFAMGKHDAARATSMLVALAMLVSVACTSMSDQPSVPSGTGGASPTGVPDQSAAAFWFDFDGVPPHHTYMHVNGAQVEGEMSNSPAHVYRYQFDPVVDVPAGALITVQVTGITGEILGWVDACCDTSTPPAGLYELDLTDAASMPGGAGTYIVEFSVPDGDASFTFLFPVRVAASVG
jgi:hypothetical protein